MKHESLKGRIRRRSSTTGRRITASVVGTALVAGAGLGTGPGELATVQVHVEGDRDLGGGRPVHGEGPGGHGEGVFGQSRSKLKVDVNPNQGKGYWTFQVQQKRADGTWKMRTTSKTSRDVEARIQQHLTRARNRHGRRHSEKVAAHFLRRRPALEPRHEQLEGWATWWPPAPVKPVRVGWRRACGELQSPP